MIKKIDIESEEYQTQLELTKQFTNKVVERFGFEYNPNDEVNESIQMGLTRNKMIYGKRYCPCFMVVGDTKEEQKKADNRLCPCTPALEDEIPSQGHCHCGIFCTSTYASTVAKQEDMHDAIATHSRGLTKEECEELLKKDEINAVELESLLEARELGFVKFNLVDTREWMEWVSQRIKGTDYLIPTTSFYQALDQIDDKKDTPVVVYCLSGSRSAYCQRIMQDLGFKQVSNLDYGISTFQGECESGDE